jgi:hypothetical protein
LAGFSLRLDRQRTAANASRASDLNVIGDDVVLNEGSATADVNSDPGAARVCGDRIVLDRWRSTTDI